MKAKEEYVDAPRETRSKDITVYAIIFLVLLVGAGIFLAVRLLHKPADTALADSKSGIVYDSSAVEGGWDQMTPEEIEAALNSKVAEGMINISMNMKRRTSNETQTNPRIIPCGGILLIAGSIRVGSRHDYPQSNRFQGL